MAQDDLIPYFYVKFLFKYKGPGFCLTLSFAASLFKEARMHNEINNNKKNPLEKYA